MLPVEPLQGFPGRFARTTAQLGKSGQRGLKGWASFETVRDQSQDELLHRGEPRQGGQVEWQRNNPALWMALPLSPGL